MGSEEQQPGDLSAARITVRQGLRRGDAPGPTPLPSELWSQRHQSSGEGEVARCRPPPPRSVRKWLSREGGGSARLTLPAALGGGASGSGAVCTMPTSFTVVPVEAQDKEGQQREEEDEGDERDRGTGESVGKRRGSTRDESVGSLRAEERVCRMWRAGGPPESPRTLWRGPHCLSAASDAGATCPSGEVRYGKGRKVWRLGWLRACFSLFPLVSATGRKEEVLLGVSRRGSGAARGRARRLPAAAWGGRSARRLRRGAGGSSAAHGGLADKENT